MGQVRLFKEYTVCPGRNGQIFWKVIVLVILKKRFI
jgi:hypothetical protein